MAPALVSCAHLPVNPVRAETAGRTEEIIGSWFAARGGRDRVVLATKVAGKGPVLRPGEITTGATLRSACEASLRRLQTDYIDLYQLHWPDRPVPWGSNPTVFKTSDYVGPENPIEQILDDPDGDHDWRLSATLDLEATDEAGEPVFSAMDLSPWQ